MTPTQAQIEAAAKAMEQEMFAPHELPLDEELHGKYLATARAAITAAAEAGNWKTIETAPKDGSEFLIWMLGNSMAVVFYDDKQKEFPWLTADGPGYHVNAPTHWMPLPEPPK